MSSFPPHKKANLILTFPFLYISLLPLHLSLNFILSLSLTLFIIFLMRRKIEFKRDIDRKEKDAEKMGRR
jgi:hypothetical protein